jgi:hypothetical protein
MGVSLSCWKEDGCWKRDEASAERINPWASRGIVVRDNGIMFWFIKRYPDESSCHRVTARTLEESPALSPFKNLPDNHPSFKVPLSFPESAQEPQSSKCPVFLKGARVYR